MDTATVDAMNSLDAQIAARLDELEALLVRRRQLTELQRTITQLSSPEDRLALFAVHEPNPGRDPLIGYEREALKGLRDPDQRSAGHGFDGGRESSSLVGAAPPRQGSLSWS